MIFTSRAARVLPAIVAAMAVALTGCAPSEPAAEESDGVILQVYGGGSGQFVENYNPLSPTVLGNVNGMIYESLFYFNGLAPLGSEPTPVLGESFRFNADGTELEVVIAPGITWSDGEPFTVDDVAFTFNTIAETPQLNTTGNAPTAEVADDTTVRLTFERPAFADGPTILGSTWMVPEHIFSAMPDVATDPNRDPVGTGPMRLAEFTAQSYLFEKSETFRRADDVEVPGVRFFSLSGNQAATDKLLAGELDLAGIAIPDVDKVLAPFPDLEIVNTGYQQVVLTTCANAQLGCTGPQTDPVVRQAISAAIDRQQINQLAYYGRGLEISPTFGMVGRDDDQIDDGISALPMAADTGRATSLLEQAGWRRGGDGIYAKSGQRLSFDVIVTSGYTDYIAALDIIKQQLQPAGIEISPQQQANAEVISARGSGKFEITIDGVFQGPTADLYYIYSNILATSNTARVGESSNPYGNVARFSDPEVDTAIQAAAGTEDVGEKARLYAGIQQRIETDLPYIPVINNRSFGVHSTTNYTGWPTDDDPYADGSDGGEAQALLRLQPV